MGKVVVLLFIAISFSSFFVLTYKKKDNVFNIACVQEMYIDNGSYRYYDEDSTYTRGEDSCIKNFIGIFPDKKDTIIIYRLNEELNDFSEKFTFWFSKNKTGSITFSCSGEKVNVSFDKKNTIIVNGDEYIVNKEYYIFLKQKIITETSILDLAFFLKDGYGDYAQLLEPLNKNWRNQKENNKHKIISTIIKNKNNQTDNKYFNHKIDYKYNKKGILESVSSKEGFKKKIVEENNEYFIYKIERLINERAIVNEYLYKNKKTLFDSIVGSHEEYSNSKTSYYSKYQANLITKTVRSKPKNIREILAYIKQS